MSKNNQIDTLLNNTKRIVSHYREKEKLKGEKFNVFSILGLESNENRTHSAFLSELLNPHGSHLKGQVFLELFLSTINHSGLDIKTVKVETEKNIGKRNDLMKEGGRIDIFISDSWNNCISIENKIYAQDQISQIERYCNYNKKQNTIFYLTLDGKEPSLESKGDLNCDEDFYLISYKEEIINWLQLCIKESVDTPILRETIKQYLLLIKKLTSTMEKDDEKELIDLMLKYYEEASFISENFNKAKQLISENVRQEVITQLSLSLKEKFIIEAGDTTQNRYSQIWIKMREKPNSRLYFGIESFSGQSNYGGHLFIGVFDQNGGKSQYASVAGTVKLNEWWINPHRLSDYNGCDTNFGNAETVKNINNSQEFKAGFIKHIVHEVTRYLENEAPSLLTFLNSKHSG